ncbi:MULTISPECIES: hypothetical protein [Oerskovia]|uniref:ABM domain-containing protein n=2 Tax=Oerskovia TaxID=162491 RepID=A0ABR8UZZ0_9CELL|nr:MULTISPECIES: hypothetical protein [Oerskovia]MBD7998112.1 hypothetical protein [Oerskovia gallyi]MBM7495838.1 hypothetical protein [Oerskovia paurometabola]
MNQLVYAPRLVRALPPVEAGGRLLKVYVMFAEPDSFSRDPDPEWLREQVTSVLDTPPGEGDHPLGFLILHHGKEGTYLLLSQWFDADMLKHWVRGTSGAEEGGESFAPLAQRELIACVWELAIIAFERNAWVNTVLAQGRVDDSSVTAYLGTSFSGWV